jgi:hypothetical protein
MQSNAFLSNKVVFSECLCLYYASFSLQITFCYCLCPHIFETKHAHNAKEGQLEQLVIEGYIQTFELILGILKLYF